MSEKLETQSTQDEAKTKQKHKYVLDNTICIKTQIT